MRFVVDMNLSPSWISFLQRAGLEAVHWSEIGRADATDHEIMQWAETNGCIVLTSDLDFSAILAATGRAGPSVVQVRSDLLRTDAIGDTVLKAIAATREELGGGALVSIDASRARVRVLPLR